MYTVQTTERNGSLPTGRDVALVPVTPALRAALAQRVARDRHGLIHPTHAVVRGGELIGYGSLGAVAMFYAWMDTQRSSARDSFAAWRAAETELKRAGHRAVCLPVEAASPFAPFTERRGYQSLGTATFNLKEL